LPPGPSFIIAVMSMIFQATPDTSMLTWHNLFHTVEGIVAVATIALASVTALLVAATYWMARKTAVLAASTRQEVGAVAEQIGLQREQTAALRDQVNVSQAEVEVSQASVNATIRPVLVDLPRPLFPESVGGGLAEDYHEVAWDGASERKRMPSADAFVWGDDGGTYITVPARNVGAGAALIRGIGLRWQRPVPGGGSVTNGVIPPNEFVRIQFTIPVYEGSDGVPFHEFIKYPTFSLEVAYTDIAGAQLTMTRFDVAIDRYGRWLTSQVHLHEKQGEHDGSIDWGEPVAGSTASWGL
jgi:hypothetical protein